MMSSTLMKMEIFERGQTDQAVYRSALHCPAGLHVKLG